MFSYTYTNKKVNIKEDHSFIRKPKENKFD